MKNLFNNIWCVSGLSLIAIGYFAFSVVTPLFDRFSPNGLGDVFDVSMDESDDMVAEQQAIDSASGNIVERENIAWFTELARDPFVLTSVSPPPDLGAAQSNPAVIKRQTVSVNSGKLQLPRLTGLFHRAAKSVAVIDGELSREGDTVSGFEVKIINKSSVVVERNGLEYSLAVARDL